MSNLFISPQLKILTFYILSPLSSLIIHHFHLLQILCTKKPKIIIHSLPTFFSTSDSPYPPPYLHHDNHLPICS
ncbi:hypothetical protein Hanom_Chr12g01148571 [Helianthus anomalus]